MSFDFTFSVVSALLTQQALLLSFLASRALCLVQKAVKDLLESDSQAYIAMATVFKLS